MLSFCRLEEDDWAAPSQPCPQPQQHQAQQGRVLRLFDLAQISAASLITLRNVLLLLDWADMARANLVKDICLQVRLALI